MKKFLMFLFSGFLSLAANAYTIGWYLYSDEIPNNATITMYYGKNRDDIYSGSHTSVSGNSGKTSLFDITKAFAIHADISPGETGDYYFMIQVSENGVPVRESPVYAYSEIQRYVHSDNWSGSWVTHLISGGYFHPTLHSVPEPGPISLFLTTIFSLAFKRKKN